jgi:AAA15 family ATPase/GTPase
MDTLQLTNYRKFKDTGVIHLKPITFLVGAIGVG